MEPIVPRDTIRDLARQAVDDRRPMWEANPYPAGTAAHHQFERDYVERQLELSVVEV
jgi:hypothetical protein